MNIQTNKQQFKAAAKWTVAKAAREGDSVFGLWAPEPKHFYHDGEPRPLCVGDYHYLNTHALRMNAEMKP